MKTVKELAISAIKFAVGYMILNIAAIVVIATTWLLGHAVNTIMKMLFPGL